jgi:asparagine synthase (glutamine-hydrolysing)
MIDAIRHRGPDSKGYWTDPQVPSFMGHARLAVQDLSSAGHQPMHSRCGRYVVSFNGEIYNHKEIRKEIKSEGVPSIWRGSSDTETLLESISFFGIQGTLRKIVGMYAIALWDCKLKTLWLIRDRFGEKPLYYINCNGSLYYASEIKAIRAAASLNLKIDRSKMGGYFAKGYMPANKTIYEGLESVPPGVSLKVTLAPKIAIEKVPYWDASDAALSGFESKRNSFSLEQEADSLEKLLIGTIKGQLLSDVPVGALLSGGVDSSLVTALMQREAPGRIKTFSLGLVGHGFDEAPYAKAIAAHLGTEHHEIYIENRDIVSAIYELPGLYDQPFADVSAIPTFLVSKFAKKDVTVVLTGDGGDELFGGYRRYSQMSRRWTRAQRIPSRLRFLMKALIGFGRLASNGRLRRRFQLLGEVLADECFRDFYFCTHRHWLDSEDLLTFESPLEVPDILKKIPCQMYDAVSVAMLVDTLVYLPEDILVKADRAAMAVSLEMRIPLLDHRIYEWAWGLSLANKNGGGADKKIAMSVLSRYVPRKLLERPKTGFGIPIGQYLRHDLRDWAEDLLNNREIEDAGFFDFGVVRKKWSEHLSGRQNWSYHLWDVLIFQAWLRSEKATIN